MSGGQFDTILRHLRKLVGAWAAEDSDGRLLERFLTRRDESAFAALLARHGPMVWGVCRRLLSEGHDAEDAFQATFLVLVRRARSLDQRGSLAGWLHEVAVRVARRARSAHHRERPLTEEVPAMNATDPATEAARRELRGLIDEELQRLPEKYRGPVLLCDVQGRTQEEAARQLGYPPGSMSWRLARGRELLRRRLERRGVVLPAGMLAAVCAEEAAAAVPGALVEATARAALLVATGAAGTLSGSVAALVDGTARALAIARLKLVAVVVMLGLLAAGAGLATHQALTADRAPPALEEQAKHDEPTPRADPPAHDPPAPDRVKPPEAAPDKKPVVAVDQQGDPLPPGAVARLGTMRLRQADGVAAFAFSPDGKLMATGGRADDDWLHVWDTSTGKLVRRLPVRDVMPLAISPDNKLLAVGRNIAFPPYDYAIWSLEMGEKVTTLAKLQYVSPAVAFSPDSKTLFACEGKGVSRWDTTTGEPKDVFSGVDSDRIDAFALAADGRSMAVVVKSGGKVIFIPTAGGDRCEFVKEGCRFTGLAFSPDSKRLAVASAYAPTLLLETPAMKEVATAAAPTPQWTLDMGFTPDGKELLAIGLKREVLAWDAATGKYLRSCVPPADLVQIAALSPTSKLAAIVDVRSSKEQHAPRLLDLTTGKDRLRLGHESSVRAISFSPDGKTLASTGSDGTTVLWEVPIGRERWRVESGNEYGGAAAFSPSGKLLVATGTSGRLELLDVITGKSQQVFGQATEYCRSVAFAPNGETVAAVANGLRLSFWGLDGLSQGSIDIKAAQITADRAGRFSAAIPGGAWLQDRAQRREPRLLKIKPEWVETQVALASEGATLAVCGLDEGAVHLFDIDGETKSSHWWFVGEHLRSVALSSHGRIVATGDVKGTVRLYDAASGKELLHLTGHEGSVQALAFSPDGRLLASAGADTTGLIWDLARAWENESRRAPLPSLTPLWNDLGGPDHTCVLRATTLLTADPARALALFKQHLKSVALDHDERLRRAVADIQDEDPKVRALALEELRRLGPVAIPPLRELQRTATSPKLQARLRAFLTLADMDGITSAPEPPNEIRAVQVLEAIGTPEARHMLKELAQGKPLAQLTQAAKAALGRLER